MFGLKVRSEGAVPAGRVSAEKEGAASLPTFTPGACWVGVLVLDEDRGVEGMENGLTPFVVRGSEGGTREWNSPWLETDSGLLFADILV